MIPAVLEPLLNRAPIDGALRSRAMTHVLVTPRFRASAHVIFLLIDQASGDPLLVAKMPRIASLDAALKREAAALHAFHDGHPELAGIAPRVVLFDPDARPAVLLETALVGDALAPEQVRRAPHHACRLAIDWLGPVAQAHALRAARERDRLLERIERELADFGRAHAWSPEERDGLAQTRTVLDRLSGTDLPVVFEHGDLSHPNLVVLREGGLGVLDWELSDPHGLVLADALFVLAYAGFARARVQGPNDAARAYEDALLGDSGWARSYLQEYAGALELEERTVGDLTLVCWTRAIIRSVARIAGFGASTRLPADTVSWLRSSRAYGVWRRVMAG